MATIGQRPAAGFALIDGEWLRQFANGNNISFVSGIVAKASGNQTTATPLSANPLVTEVDTVATTHDSVSLPFAAAGMIRCIFNNGAASLDIFANPNTNPLTGITDVINKTTNSSAFTITTGQAVVLFCAKNGIWAVVKTA